MLSFALLGVWGLLPQALTLAAMLLPILLGIGSELVALVFISGIATVVVHPATLGCLSVFAAVRSPKQAAATMAASILSLFAVTLAFGAAGLTSLILGNIVLYQTAVILSLVLVCQGTYYLVLAYATRVGSYSDMVRIRLVYGVISFVSMLVASTIWLSEFSLPVAAAVSFGGTTLVAVAFLLKKIPWALLIAIEPASVVRRAWELRKDCAVFLLAGLAGQSSSLALAFLGPLAVPFATATRLANGFQTVGAQVIAPKFDIAYAGALRRRDYAATAHIYKRATLWGLGLAIIGVVAAIGVISTLGEFRKLSESERIVVCLSIVLFWGTQIAASVVGKFLTFGGFASLRLWNELGRALPLVVILVFFRESALLIWLSLVMSISMVIFINLGRLRSRTPRLRNS